MAVPLRLRRGLTAAVVAASVPLALASTAGALPASSADPSPSTSSSPGPGSPDAPAPEPTDVDAAREAADAVSAEVATITKELDVAEARLEALQEDVARAVTAQEEAEAALSDAEAAASAASDALADARAEREGAHRILSGHAALMYMQGGDLQAMTTMLLAPPNAVSDASLVLDNDAQQVQQHLDDATAAAADAAVREALLTIARDDQADALEAATRAREQVTRKAKEATAEAAELGAKQEELTARLAELNDTASDLEARRALAARDGVALLGLQAEGAAGSAPREAQEIARTLMPEHGWDESEFACLVTLWHHESGWSWSATNPSSGAYGIPQALPGWKMAIAGDDWLTNPKTQIEWGLGYIESTYGSPCKAFDAFSSRSPHWY